MSARFRPLLVVLAWTFVPAACGAEPRPVDLTEVSVARSPGKDHVRFDPERPAEEIAAGVSEGGFWIEVRVNVRREGVEKFTVERTDLTQSEWSRIRTIVHEDRLLEWTPGSATSPPHDWGSGGVTIVAAERREWTWDAQPPNADALVRLTKALTGLAREKLPGLVLHYIHPPG